MNVVDDFTLQLHYATRLDPRQQGQRLLELLRVHPQANPYVVKLNAIGDLQEQQISVSVEKRNFFNGDWIAFDQAVVAFILLNNQMDPWSILQSFDLYANYLNSLSIAFTNKARGHLLTLLLQDTIEFVLPLAKQLDFQMLIKELHRKPRLTYIASILLKIFNNIRSQLGADDHIEAAKKSIMLFTGTKLCQAYFYIGNPLLCRNVFSNMNNAHLHFADYPANQQMQYRFYLAKFYVVKYQFVDAYTHFLWCLKNIPTVHARDHPNVTKILVEFLPVSIILGKRPNLTGFATTFYSADSVPHFFSIYSEILSAIVRGSLHGLHQAINKNINFLTSTKMALLLSSKALIVTLRNLLRKVWALQGRSTRLEYDSVKAAIGFSLQGLSFATFAQIGGGGDAGMHFSDSWTRARVIDDLTIENCFVSLIDQNLIRGKVFPRLRVVSLAKSDVFPPIAPINFLKFGNGVEGAVNAADEWIGQK